ncbi:lysophospholipid acyltransferase family protein [Lapillicoccus sp.]|uniref:lysophospholipid acyltransferase family protein n=1 Tax=Lapillicoccus sp. TaxID=1909287 RepID=UPI0025CE5720|nr:lysophospholipid acyltransferase family protein [Lapillicoccus sp.]
MATTREPTRAKGRDALAAGAARASGERARRTRTPLLAPSQIVSTLPPAEEALLVRPDGPLASAPLASPPHHRPGSAVRDSTADDAGDGGDAGEADETARHTGKHRPHPEPRPTAPSASAFARSGTRVDPTPRPTRRPGAASRAAKRATKRTRRTLQAVPDLGVAALTVPTPPTVPALETSIRPGFEDLLVAAVAALRTVASATGIAPEEVEAQVAGTLAFLRRRLTGDFTIDEFGFDEDFTLGVYLPLLRPLYRSWFRVEVRGIENIPAAGGGLVVANHSGTVAMDSLMTQVAVHDEHPAHRHLRMLGADLVFSTPVVGQLARKSGTTLATNPDAERLLGEGQLVGVWPEGFKGVGKPFSERYKLQRFGRGGFVSAAIRAGVPIIPCSIVGAEEIYPIIGNMRTLARLLGAPYAPVTPTWPLLGPLGLIPLPSKWIIEFGVPVQTDSLRAGAADDPMLVFDLTDQIRETIQQTLYSLLMQRRSVFF